MMISPRHLAVLLSFSLPALAQAQAPGVPVYAEGGDVQQDATILMQCRALKDKGDLVDFKKVDEQLGRKTCSLKLPKVGTTRMARRDLWQRARKSHLRVGWIDKIADEKEFKVELSGGYAITNDTVATCGHVIGHDDDLTEGYLIAVDDDDKVYPVTEVLAVNLAADCAILRLKTDQLTALPLSTDVVPGDRVYCFSDPVDRRGFFSEGIVNRFLRRRFLHNEEIPEADRKDPARTESPVWMCVTDDWAQGSSGSAVIDAYGNAVGHVSEIQSVMEDPLDPEDDTEAAKLKAASEPRGTVIIFHEAIAAQHILSLIKPQP
jgi:hypothetical protein